MRVLFYSLILLSAITGIAREKTFDLKSGPYELKISEKYKYTVRQIKYEGAVLGTQSGFYGTVMAHGSGKYVGAGHGEGGFEKVLKVELIADGKQITPVAGKTYSGKKFLLRKISMFDKLRFQSEITLSADGIVERKRFVATAKQPIHLMYIYLLCWNKSTDGWLAEGVDGKKYSGEFGSKFKGRSRWHLQKDVKWAANIDSKSGKAMLMYYPNPIVGQGRRSSFWEVKKAYNKYYLMLKTPKIYPAGYESPVYTLILKGFAANKSDFLKNAETTVKKASKIKLDKLKEVKIPKVKKVTKKKSNLQEAVSFSVDYTETTSTIAKIDAKQAKGDKSGKILLTKKAVFDFDNMAHTIRGLAIGTKGSTVRYNTLGNLIPKKGSIELVVKADDWAWNDKKVHIFMQTAIPRTKGVGKLYLYKYKTSGLALYLELNKTGEKVFLNCPVKGWKDKSWHHVTVSYSPDEIVLYVDGVRRKGAQLGTIKEWASSFYVGPASTKFGYVGKSTISFLNMYDRPLSAQEVKVLAKERLPDLKIDISAKEAALTGKKIIGKPSPWFKNRPKLGLKALEDDTVIPPWTAVKYNKGSVSVWGREYKLSGNGILDSIIATGIPLLKAPIALEIIADGKKQKLNFAAPEIIKQGKGRIILKRQSVKGGSISASIEYMIEFDGMVWNKLIIKPGKQKITGMKMIVPFTKENAKFIHYVGAPNIYESQDLIKNSFSRALGAEKGLLFKSGFRTNVWIGDNNRGLLWFAESEQNWWPKQRKDMIEVSRNASGDVDLTLNMVIKDIPYGKKSELVYKFGLMATPVKPLPAGWRGETFSAQYNSFTKDRRGTNLIYWPNEWRWMMLDPEPHRAENVKVIREKVKRDSGEKRKIIPYWTRLHYPVKADEKLNQDAVKMQKAWSTIPGRPGGGSHQMYRAACTSEWTDYLVWCVDQWTKVMGHVDGVYIDETQPIPNSKALSGGGYDDLKGVRRPTFEIFGSRNFIKRVTYNIWKRNNETPSSIAHCSATHTMPTLSMYKMMLIGEQYYSGYFTNDPEFLPPEKDCLYYYSYALPMDRLRAECYWKQWGAMMVFLPCMKNKKDIMKNPIPTRDMLSRIMQADMLVWPLFCDSREVYKTWKFRREFGISEPGVSFTPYWENKTITSNVKDAVVGYYKNGEKYLVLVSNLNRSAETVELTFKGITLQSVKNAETNKNISTNGNKVKLNILRNDYVALRVNY